LICPAIVWLNFLVSKGAFVCDRHVKGLQWLILCPVFSDLRNSPRLEELAVADNRLESLSPLGMIHFTHCLASWLLIR
jgi:hypothetical protein